MANIAAAFHLHHSSGGGLVLLGIVVFLCIAGAGGTSKIKKK